MAQRDASKQRVADEIGEIFAGLPYVDGICLFGSVARGQWSEWSDIDLLVVGAEDELRPTRLLDHLPRRLRDERISLSCYSGDQIRQLADLGSSFIDHVRLEGKILYDREGTLKTFLSKKNRQRPKIKPELEAELERLSLYDDLSIYRGNVLLPLANIYSVGKSIVMLGLVAAGQPLYERDAAFERFKTLRPHLRSDVETLARLRPFYSLVTRRGTEPLPFSYRDAGTEVRHAVSAARRLATTILDSE